MDRRDAANRDLLIGLFALQNGLVDQSVLGAAFRESTRDKSRPIWLDDRPDHRSLVLRERSVTDL
jgi:hypothetical protein